MDGLTMEASVTPVPSPERFGLDSAVLAGALNRILDEKVAIDSVLVARQGHIALDTYKYPYRTGLRRDVRSVTKSITALVCGALFADQVDFGMSQPIRADGAFNLGQALSMTHGVAAGVDGDEAPQLVAMYRSPDWAQFMEDLPRFETPGTRFRYSSGGYHLVSAFISKVTGQTLAAHAQRLLFEPLGITDWLWRQDPKGRSTGGMGLHIAPRDLARIGQMMLDGGRCDGRQVIPEDWIKAVAVERVKTGRGKEGYCYGFWLPGDRPGVYEMQGRGGQQVSLWPDKDLMIVVTGSGYPDEAFAPLFEGLVVSDSHMSPSAAGDDALAEAIAKFETPPKATEVTRPGTQAAPMLGVRLTLTDDGILGARSVSVTQSGAEGTFRLEAWLTRTINFPVGFDSVPRIQVDDTVASPICGTGTWIAPDHLHLVLTSYGDAWRLNVDMDFRSDGKVRLRMTEGSSQFQPIDAIAEPSSASPAPSPGISR
jgi:CubicO group peptidase (beta-lactamase class C family)